MPPVQRTLGPATRRELRYNSKTTISTRSPAYFEYSEYLFRNPHTPPVDPALSKKTAMSTREVSPPETLFLCPCKRSCSLSMPTIEDLSVPSNQPSNAASTINCSKKFAPAQRLLHWHIHSHPAGVDQCKQSADWRCLLKEVPCFNSEMLNEALEHIRCGKPSSAETTLLDEFRHINSPGYVYILPQPATPS